MARQEKQMRNSGICCDPKNQWLHSSSSASGILSWCPNPKRDPDTRLTWPAPHSSFLCIQMQPECKQISQHRPCVSPPGSLMKRTLASRPDTWMPLCCMGISAASMHFVNVCGDTDRLKKRMFYSKALAGKKSRIGCKPLLVHLRTRKQLEQKAPLTSSGDRGHIAPFFSKAEVSLAGAAEQDLSLTFVSRTLWMRGERALNCRWYLN